MGSRRRTGGWRDKGRDKVWRRAECTLLTAEGDGTVDREDREDDTIHKHHGCK